MSRSLARTIVLTRVFLFCFVLKSLHHFPNQISSCLQCCWGVISPHTLWTTYSDIKISSTYTNIKKANKQQRRCLCVKQGKVSMVYNSLPRRISVYLDTQAARWQAQVCANVCTTQGTHQSYLMHIRENQQSQLLANINCVHSKIIFQFGDGDKTVKL